MPKISKYLILIDLEGFIYKSCKLTVKGKMKIVIDSNKNSHYVIFYKREKVICKMILINEEIIN
jgi:hypothetical protein